VSSVLPNGSVADERPSFLQSALLTYGTTVSVAGLSLVNVLIVARTLGPAGRGEVAFLTTVAYLTSQLAILGIHQANVNFSGRDPGLRPALATNSVLLAAGLGVLAIGAVALLVAIVPGAAAGSDTLLRWVALAAIPMLVLQTCLVQLVVAQYGFKVVNAATLITPVGNVLLNGILALSGVLSVGLAIGVYFGGQAVATGVLAWYVGRRFARFGRPDLELGRRMLGFGLKAHGGRVMLLGNYRLDQWIVGGVAGPRELGLYSVAVAWSEALFLLPTALVLVQRPDLVRASRRDAARQAAAIFRAAASLTLILAIAILLMAPFLCVTLFGGDFRGSVDDLRVLALGAFGIVALKLLGNALTAQAKPLLETAAIGVSFLTIVALDVLLIPAHGGLGAAIASAVAYTVGGIAVALIFSRALASRVSELAPRGTELVWLWRRLREAARPGTP
jgi:O-antigen/teichoic acid export membrane protein